MMMSEKDFHDLLIRLDERQANMEKALVLIQAHLRTQNCQTNEEKIRTLEKLTWGAILASVTAVVRTFWDKLT